MYKSIAFVAAAAASVYTVNFSSTTSNDEFKLVPSKSNGAKEYEKVVNENGFEFEEHFVTT